MGESIKDTYTDFQKRKIEEASNEYEKEELVSFYDQKIKNHTKRPDEDNNHEQDYFDTLSNTNGPFTIKNKKKVADNKYNSLYNKKYKEVPHHLKNFLFPEDTILETSAGKEGDGMSNELNESLYKEIKDDMREREERTRREISEREERFNSSMERYHQDNKEREERYIDLAHEIKQDTKRFKSELKSELLELKQYVKDSNNELKEDFHDTQNTLSDLTKHNESLATTNKWSNIATIVGIGAIVVTVIIGLVTFMITL